MPKNRWYDPSKGEALAIEEAAPSGGSFPDFTGSGSPEGVVTAEPGKTYRDTANGSLYVKASSSDNTGWAGLALLNFADTADGITFGASQIFLLANEVLLSDVGAWNGTGNGVDYRGTSGDGSQRLFIQLGDTGQFVTKFNADGTTQFPGWIKGPTGDRMHLVGNSSNGGGVTIADATTEGESGVGNGIFWETTGVDGAQYALILLGSTGQFSTRFNADGTTEFPGPIKAQQVILLSPAAGQGVFIGDQPGWDNSGNGIALYSGAADGDQNVEIALGPDGAFTTRFNADGSVELPGLLTVRGDIAPMGDEVFAAGKGPVIYDDADGHTYRIGSHNGAVTLTQVT